MTEPNLELLRAAFPTEVIKHRPGGRGASLAYVDTTTVIKRLNEACPLWDFAVIWENEENGVIKALGQLTIPGLGIRQHIGVQLRTGKQGSEDMEAKGAVSDALKKCATLFGVGLDLYGDDLVLNPDAPSGERPPPREYPQPAPPRNAPQAPSAPLSGTITIPGEYHTDARNVNAGVLAGFLEANGVTVNGAKRMGDSIVAIEGWVRGKLGVNAKVVGTGDIDDYGKRKSWPSDVYAFAEYWFSVAAQAVDEPSNVSNFQDAMARDRRPAAVAASSAPEEPPGLYADEDDVPF